MPVVERGDLVGMLSDRDVGQLDMARLLAVEGAKGLRQELSTLIINVMSSDVLCVEPESELGDVIDLLLEHKVGALPVVLPDTREVVGIVSYIDVLRALRDQRDEG